MVAIRCLRNKNQSFYGRDYFRERNFRDRIRGVAWLSMDCRHCCCRMRAYSEREGKEREREIPLKEKREIFAGNGGVEGHTFVI